MTDTMTDTAKRADLIAGIRKLADYLEANPDLKVRRVYAHHAPDSYKPAGQRAELATVLAILGDDATVDTDVAYNGMRVQRRFGEHVEFYARFDVDAVCVPTVVYGKVVWALADPLVPAEAA